MALFLCGIALICFQAKKSTTFFKMALLALDIHNYITL